MKKLIRVYAYGISLVFVAVGVGLETSPSVACFVMALGIAPLAVVRLPG